MSTSPTDQPTDARARLLSHFSSAQTTSQHASKWDELWKDDFLPWDKGFPNPALVDLLTSRHQSLPPRSSNKRKKALVPGCGKGYDVLLLAAFGYDAYGLEYSSVAIEACKKNEEEVGGKDVYESRVEGGSVTWLSGDFWADDWFDNVDGDAEFDVIYDYTVSCVSDWHTTVQRLIFVQFLSALHPSMRPAWSKRFVQLLAPEGRVICIEFPTYKPASTGGPPWALPPKIYLAHLTRPGIELPYAEDGELEESRLGEKTKDALVRLEHFQPERTHQIGYSEDGKGTDWIGIWAHPKQ